MQVLMQSQPLTYVRAVDETTTCTFLVRNTLTMCHAVMVCQTVQRCKLNIIYNIMLVLTQILNGIPRHSDLSETFQIYMLSVLMN